MNRIIDMTLSCLDSYNPSPKQLEELVGLLFGVGADLLEMSEVIYRRLEGFSPDGRFILRLKSIDDAVLYPQFKRFVCRRSGFITDYNITCEYQTNDVREINLIGQTGKLRNIRVTGLDDILLHDYIRVFKNLQTKSEGHVELCPENGYSCATAIAVEWIMNGGSDVVVSFSGLCGKASLEEVAMALRIAKRFKPNQNLSSLSRLSELVGQILARPISGKKAVIGKTIFDVESGIHIDGISKNPKNYEPFAPELVGGTRRIVLGKHSGRKSITLKLRELELSLAESRYEALLGEIKERSISKMSGITDEEFIDMVNRHNSLI